MTRTGLKPTGRQISCSLCGDSSGRCRTNGELHLCMSFPDGCDDLGWYFHGPSKGQDPGLWGIYTKERVKQKSWHGSYLEERDSRGKRHLPRIKFRRKQAPTLRPGFTEVPTSTIEQRAAAYGELFKSFELSAEHRQNLSERFGFPVDDTNAAQVGAVSVGSSLGFKCSQLFPGGAGPDHLATFKPAMALSITDEQGRIIGVELRLDDPGQGGRYRWLSRPEECELGVPDYDGENPIGIFAPLSADPRGRVCTGRALIGISEGRGMKPRIAASKWGFPVIGGGGHAAVTGSPIQLNRFLIANPAAAVLLLVDGGGLENPRVVQQLVQTVLFCRLRGFEVLIPWWNQCSKDDPDPDEVPFAAELIGEGAARAIKWQDGRIVRLWTPEDLGLPLEAV